MDDLGDIKDFGGITAQVVQFASAEELINDRAVWTVLYSDLHHLTLQLISGFDLYLILYKLIGFKASWK